MEFKSIDDLSKKIAVQGTEKIPVSSTEYIDTEQIKEYILEENDPLYEKLANKQNSLTTDGTGAKYPTVDAVNEGLALKADTVDVMQNKQSIATLESILSDVNINQEAQVTASGVDTVVLPKTAANTGMQVQMFGQSAENLVVNGDFRNGTTGWEVSNVSGFTVINGIAEFTPTNRYGRLQQTVNNPNGILDKWYLRALVKPDKSKVALSFQGAILQYHSGSGNYEVLSGLRTTTFLTPLVQTQEYDTSGFTKIYVDNVMVINLTATFGAGNEPTKEQCDKLFANYFEGTANTIGTGRVRSVGRNLLDSSKDGKRIYTGQEDGLTVEQRYATYDILIGGTRNSFIIPDYINNYSIEGDKVIVNNTIGGHGVTFKFKAIAGKRYYKSAVLSSGINGVGIGIFDKSGNLLAHGTTAFVDAPENSSFGVLCLTSDTFNRDITYTNVGVFETSLPAIYEPYRESSLYFNGGTLRSNGTIKDEIRKGTNGYELVKRVGVGDITGAVEKITNNTFETDLNGWSAFAGTISREAGTRTGGSGSYVMRVVSNGVQGSSRRISILTNGKWYKITGWAKSDGTSIPQISVGGSDAAGWVGTSSTSWQYFSFFIRSNGLSLYLRSTGGAGTYTDWDDVYCYELPIAGDISSASEITEFSNNIIHYTLATPVIAPIAHAGLLNSNSNGTVYFEPAVADAGVYGSSIAIQLTDFPISTIESISKYENGVFTPLNPATAVIAVDGLSFTHPDLASGDLVTFTYMYNLESTGRSMTLTHYDSRYVVKDTANDDVYKITPKITSGELTWELTLV